MNTLPSNDWTILIDLSIAQAPTLYAAFTSQATELPPSCWVLGTCFKMHAIPSQPSSLPNNK